MLNALLRSAGFDLQAQLASFKAQAEEFKERTTDQIKGQVLEVGITAGLAVAAIVFVLMTIVVGLIALYLWVAQQHGPFVALGVVALATAIMAGALFTIAATRGEGASRRLRAEAATAKAKAAALRTAAKAEAAADRFSDPPSPAQAYASLASAIAQGFTGNKGLGNQAASAASEAIDTAADLVKKGSPQTVLATLAVAVVAGYVIGRRR
jgi:hypothetical protein